MKFLAQKVSDGSGKHNIARFADGSVLADRASIDL
jgi:hypothetical protein